jgi:hypothetical protein
MRMSSTAVELSASDLSGFLSCIHLTALDLAVAQGKRQPPSWIDPVLIVLRERGLDHERGYVDELRAQGLSITDLDGTMGDDAVRRSVEAIRAGADVILQPSLALPSGKRASAMAVRPYRKCDTGGVPRRASPIGARGRASF